MKKSHIRRMVDRGGGEIENPRFNFLETAWEYFQSR